MPGKEYFANSTRDADRVRVAHITSILKLEQFSQGETGRVNGLGWEGGGVGGGEGGGALKGRELFSASYSFAGCELSSCRLRREVMRSAREPRLERARSCQ